MADSVSVDPKYQQCHLAVYELDPRQAIYGFNSHQMDSCAVAGAAITD